VTKVKI